MYTHAKPEPSYYVNFLLPRGECNQFPYCSNYCLTSLSPPLSPVVFVIIIIVGCGNRNPHVRSRGAIRSYMHNPSRFAPRMQKLVTHISHIGLDVARRETGHDKNDGKKANAPRDFLSGFPFLLF